MLILSGEDDGNLAAVTPIGNGPAEFLEETFEEVVDLAMEANVAVAVQGRSLEIDDDDFSAVLALGLPRQIAGRAHRER